MLYSYILVCAFLYLGVLIFDLIPLCRRREIKIICIYLPIFLFTLIVNIFYGLGVTIPNLAKPVTELIHSIFHL